MALLLECQEIRRLWPVYNRALKRFEPKFGLYAYEDQNGYMRLATGRLAKHQSCIQPFGRLYDAVKTMGALVALFGLDPRFCAFGFATARFHGRTQPSNNTYAQPGDQAHTVLAKPPQAYDNN